MTRDDYEDRLARNEPWTLLHAFGHPGAFQREHARAERLDVELEACRAALRTSAQEHAGLCEELHELRTRVERQQKVLDGLGLSKAVLDGIEKPHGAES